jgi:hypothetical protein
VVEGSSGPVFERIIKEAAAVATGGREGCGGALGVK